MWAASGLLLKCFAVTGFRVVGVRIVGLKVSVTSVSGFWDNMCVGAVRSEVYVCILPLILTV